jgi:hypothetical protein
MAELEQKDESSYAVWLPSLFILKHKVISRWPGRFRVQKEQYKIEEIALNFKESYNIYDILCRNFQCVECDFKLCVTVPIFYPSLTEILSETAAGEDGTLNVVVNDVIDEWENWNRLHFMSTPRVNFTNVLRAAFSYESFAQLFLY